MIFMLSFEAEEKSAGILSNIMNTYENLLNESLNNINYGDELDDIGIISLCYIDTEDLTERKLFIRREKSADIRLFIDYKTLCTSNRYEQFFIYKDHIIQSVETLRIKVKKTYRFDDLISDIEEALSIIGGVIYWKSGGWSFSERLKVSEELLGYDESTQNNIICKITNSYTVKTSSFRYIYIGGEMLLLMPEDLVYTINHEWKPVISLKRGDLIQNISGDHTKVMQIRNIEMEKPYKTFRFLTDYSNIFFTGYAGVLVKPYL